ncbi:MAG: cysteine--tRNA ligase [Bacteroidota bacterium]|nr:cysteine--tRNA ligase [Bacteroidota bacterium]
MAHILKLYNSASRVLEDFHSIHPDFVGIYLCGPTVYSSPHLGHTRGALTVDLLIRWFRNTGKKVRYVRNITDVGHLTNDSEIDASGEDKLSKKAKIEQLEPMEIAQKYYNEYDKVIAQLNIVKPNIEPLASGHILEQIEMIQKIMKEGMAYETNGSVYFDIEAYNNKYTYGSLSGRKLEDMISGAAREKRTLEGQTEKKNSFDFALWKKADETHIMQWVSPWGRGFPGWHLECSAMSHKYLGEKFDIHFGGIDLLFPHHECEIAQSQAAHKVSPVKYWLHNNMITINGQKMARSLNNGILVEELFAGSHPLLNQPYKPMTLRFFLLQAHYRSTVDFSNDALKAAEKGFDRLSKTHQYLNVSAKASLTSNHQMQLEDWESSLYDAFLDDLNTPSVLAQLFDAAKWVQKIKLGKWVLDEKDLNKLKNIFNLFFGELLGLQPEVNISEKNNKEHEIMEVILKLRKQAKENKNYNLADTIREELQKIGIKLNDTNDGTSYEME